MNIFFKWRYGKVSATTSVHDVDEFIEWQQMLGKRYNLRDSDCWDSERPRSEIVMIGGRDGIDPEELQRAFDVCVGTGDEAQSPVLRLARKLFPEHEAILKVA